MENQTPKAHQLCHMPKMLHTCRGAPSPILCFLAQTKMSRRGLLTAWHSGRPPGIKVQGGPVVDHSPELKRQPNRGRRTNDPPKAPNEP